MATLQALSGQSFQPLIMSTIAFSFVQSNDPIGRVIQFYERGPWSHVDCVLPDGSLLGARSDSVGGKPPGVQIRPPDYETWPKRDIVELAATPEQITTWLNFLKSQIGQPYATADLIMQYLTGDGGGTIDSEWWCSKLAARSGEASLWLPKPIGQSVNTITPRDWYIIVTPWRC